MGFEREIEDNMILFGEKIDSAYYDFVQCALDNECCAIDEKTVRNAWTTATGHQSSIHKLELDINELKIKLEEIENECPVEWSGMQAAAAAEAAAAEAAAAAPVAQIGPVAPAVPQKTG